MVTEFSGARLLFSVFHARSYSTNSTQNHNIFLVYSEDL